MQRRDAAYNLCYEYAANESLDLKCFHLCLCTLFCQIIYSSVGLLCKMAVDIVPGDGKIKTHTYELIH